MVVEVLTSELLLSLILGIYDTTFDTELWLRSGAKERPKSENSVVSTSQTCLCLTMYGKLVIPTIVKLEVC